VVELSNVRKTFNIGKPNEFTAINGVSLSIDAHRVSVLKGPSGSGKTTLLGIIGCMLRPTAGRIRLLGVDMPWAPGGGSDGFEVTSLPERFLTDIRRRTFGFIFQHFNLVKGIMAIENVMLPAYPSGERSTAIKNRALEILKLLGIEGRASTRVEFLSGGEAQRVTIARALINNPSVIIADEPTAHLDTKLSQEFMGIIRHLKKIGKTAIIASHDPIVYESPVIDRVVTIRDGRIDSDLP
jgi:putative ABC transport system ATP-binding protein